MKTIAKLFIVLAILTALVGLIAAPSAEAQAFALRTLYGFSGGSDGMGPYAGLIMDASGNLYGTTFQGGAYGQGTVFELVNSSGTYTEKVLHSFPDFSGDGVAPRGGVIMDASGNLYGTTMQGGANGRGTVFELVNSSGTYTEKVLYSFTGSGGDGSGPWAGLIMDASGNLYGTAGAVFELVNSSGTYTEKVLYTFADSGSVAGLIMDASGNLYGTTILGGSGGWGRVFELVNSSGTYTERVLYNFGGDEGAVLYSGLIMDALGNLYGTTTAGGTYGQGTVFELVNSSGTYSHKTLYNFCSYAGDGGTPFAGVIMDASGNLYGTTVGGGTAGGTVFELVNSSGTYSEKLLHTFLPYGSDGNQPWGGLMMDSWGNLYGTTVLTGGELAGTVFELVPPYKAFVQQPINTDGSSVFSANRGVVPVKFTLTLNDAPTCTLPAATISVSRTGGGTLGSIDESTYSMAADTGSNFRIDQTACQYVYNLAASSLGVGTYQVDININGLAVGHTVFALK